WSTEQIEAAGVGLRYWNLDVLGSQTTRAGDSRIQSRYDAERNEIVVDNVVASTGGAQVRIEGALLSSNTLGRINVSAGLGRAEIDNQSGIQVVVNNVYAGAGGVTSATESSVEILDTLRDRHDLY